MTIALEWDYSGLAAAYRFRPGYATAAIDACLGDAGVTNGMRACDVGAGIGTLTVELSRRGLRVAAVEPNDDMRADGIARTHGEPRISWTAAVGEALPVGNAAVDVVTFGSSLNVVDQERAIAECARVLRPHGALVCLWNHRRLDDPLQHAIEEVVRAAIVGWCHGRRRDDQTAALVASGAFNAVHRVEEPFVAVVTVADFMAAWKSHLTLRRQAGAHLAAVLAGIRALLPRRPDERIAVPYVTRAWVACRSADRVRTAAARAG